MVYFMENPSIKWMRTGGTCSLGNHHVDVTCKPRTKMSRFKLSETGALPKQKKLECFLETRMRLDQQKNGRSKHKKQ